MEKNMKVAIISVVNFKHMTASSIYIDYFKKNNISVDLIYIDKYNVKEDIPYVNSHRFVNKGKGLFWKISSAFKFRKYAKNIIKENEYDYIIFWNTQTTFLMGMFLSKKYKNKIIINIRDYFHEKIRLIRMIEKKIFKIAALVTVSSEGFIKFLPKGQYTIMHSYNKEIIESAKPKRGKKVDDKINVTFIGKVRFFEQDKNVLQSFKNDSRFKLQYFGTNAKILEKYSKKEGILNSSFLDSFPVKTTSRLLNKTDIINNLYGFDDMSLDYAISIRTYYAGFLHIPILVYQDTYMDEFLSDYSFAIVIPRNSIDLPEYVYIKYNELLKSKEFHESCNSFQKKIIGENNLFYKELDKLFIMKGNY